MEARRVLIVGVALIGLSSCGSTKRVTSSQVEVVEEKQEKTFEKETVFQVIDYYGDTMSGTIPLRPLSQIPQVIPVRSTGIDLELTLTDTGLTYKAVARPVARSSLTKETEKATESDYKKTEETSEKVTEKRKAFSLPWWIYGIVITAMIIAILRVLNITKNPFKWF